MKKIGKILGLIGSAFVLLLAIGALFGAFDDEVADITDGAMADNTRMMGETEDGTLVEIKTNDRETEEEPKAGEEQTETTVNGDNHFYIGDTIKYTSGLEITLINAGILQNQIYEPVLYLEMELYNGSNEEGGLSNSEFSLYIDDYQVNVTPTVLNTTEAMDAVSYQIELNPGRKAKYTFRTILLSEYDNASKIEIELPGSTKTVLVKDNGVYLNGIRPEDYVDNSLDESLYGDHVNMDGNDFVLVFMPFDNNEVSAAVSIHADGSHHQYLLFMEDEKNGYLTLLTGLSKVGSVCFGEDGIEVNLDNAVRYSGLYAYNQQDMSSAEMDIPREYDSEGILGRYTQIGNPRILLFVEEFDGIIFTVDSGDDIISAGMGNDGLLYIGTDSDDDIAGNFTIDGNNIILTNMINPEFNGTYQK